jgi:hypothetical protein
VTLGVNNKTNISRQHRRQNNSAANVAAMMRGNIMRITYKQHRRGSVCGMTRIAARIVAYRVIIGVAAASNRKWRRIAGVAA